MALTRRFLPSVRSALFIWLGLLYFPGVASSQDRVVLRNGVALEGEIKQARRGAVSFDNEELDVVTIDMEDIAQLTSPGFFEVTDASGGIYLGSLEAGDAGSVVVVGLTGLTTLNLTDVVQLVVFDGGFWGRTSGHLDVGGSVAAANDLASLLVGGQVAYRGPRWGSRNTVDAYWQRQTTIGELGGELEQITKRASLSTALTRYLGAWGVLGSLGWETNEELQLQSRVQAGMFGSYRFVRSQGMDLSAGAGAVTNTENFVGADKSTSAELATAAVLDVFDLWDIDVYVAVSGYSALKEGSRKRADVDGRISWEIVDDFTIGFTILERLDSDPPAEGTPKRDYQYGFTIGWTWS